MKQLQIVRFVTSETKLKEPTGIREAIHQRQAPPIGPKFITITMKKGEPSDGPIATIRKNAK